MHRSWTLILLSVLACNNQPERGPTATTIAIMQTEPVAARTATPALATVVEGDEGSVEEDALAVALGPAAEADPVDLPRGVTVEVRTGENLVLLARWAGSSVEAVSELNGLDPTDPLFPGQSLLLPSADEARDAQLIASRESFAQARLERYLERRGGLMAVEEHRVRTGETAWAIARDQLGIPTWVLAAYNPDKDLEHLGIGERLLVPVLSDTVADAGRDEEEAEIGGTAALSEAPVPSVFDEVELPAELDLPAIEDTVRIGESPVFEEDEEG